MKLLQQIYRIRYCQQKEKSDVSGSHCLCLDSIYDDHTNFTTQIRLILKSVDKERIHCRL
jgi:hypothetical protein